MAFWVDRIEKDNGGVISNEPIMVTITLAEYRSLIEENTRLNDEICNLRAENYELRNKNERMVRSK